MIDAAFYTLIRTCFWQDRNNFCKSAEKSLKIFKYHDGVSLLVPHWWY
jgi:hypothetical protein